MRKFWGAATEIADLGVVAESCPYCAQIMPCLLRSVCRGRYACLAKTTDPWIERSCLCTGCHKPFRGEHWRYTAALRSGRPEPCRRETCWRGPTRAWPSVSS